MSLKVYNFICLEVGTELLPMLFSQQQPFSGLPCNRTHIAPEVSVNRKGPHFQSAVPHCGSFNDYNNYNNNNRIVRQNSRFLQSPHYTQTVSNIYYSKQVKDQLFTDVPKTKF